MLISTANSITNVAIDAAASSGVIMYTVPANKTLYVTSATQYCYISGTYVNSSGSSATTIPIYVNGGGVHMPLAAGTVIRQNGGGSGTLIGYLK